MDVSTKIIGLRELQASLRAIDGKAQRQLRVAFNRAADTLVGRVRPKVPRRSGAAAGSVRSTSQQRSARVSAGGAKAPYYPWLDFGGRLAQGPSRPFLKIGRYLYPTLAAYRPEIERQLAAELRQLVESAGLDVD